MSTPPIQSLFYQNSNFEIYILKTKQVMTALLSLLFSKIVRQVSDSRETGHISN